MKKSLFIVAGFVILGATLISNNSGVATVQAKDRTGSPIGEPQQCGQCHAGATFTAVITNRLRDSSGAIVTSYVPGAAYTYEVELSSSSTTAKFGFQSVGLFQATNTQAGTLTALSSNAKVVTLSGRRYAEHTARSTPGLFQMTWVAPSAGSGTVRFYMAGIACNSSSSTSGDKAVTGTPLTITESIGSTVAEEKLNPIKIYPNPASDFITVDFGNESTAKVIITSTDGKIEGVYHQQVNSLSTLKIPVDHLSSGVYLINVLGDDQQTLSVNRFIKQ